MCIIHALDLNGGIFTSIMKNMNNLFLRCLSQFICIYEDNEAVYCEKVVRKMPISHVPVAPGLKN